MTIEVINKSKNSLPEYKFQGDSGLDVRADLSDPVVIPAGKRTLIPTGLYFKLPKGYEFQVRPRSGVAIDHGITVLNSPGTIDSNYTGELKVILYNSSNWKDYTVMPGDRIAQIVLQKVPVVKWKEVSSFDEKDGEETRGAGGFGHTGIK